jgi:DNA-binding HxlR family transcriptional regulator
MSTANNEIPAGSMKILRWLARFCMGNDLRKVLLCIVCFWNVFHARIPCRSGGIDPVLVAIFWRHDAVGCHQHRAAKLLELYKGPEHTRRFSDLKESLGDITQKILFERLKELEGEGVITKKIDTTTFPVKSEYTLNRSGLELVDVIRGIKMWALKWKIENIPCGKQDCRACVL